MTEKAIPLIGKYMSILNYFIKAKHKLIHSISDVFKARGGKAKASGIKAEAKA